MKKDWKSFKDSKLELGKLYDITNDDPFQNELLNVRTSLKCQFVDDRGVMFMPVRYIEPFSIRAVDFANWWFCDAEETESPVCENTESIEKAVENICYSLRNKPYEWEIDSLFITHLPSRIRFHENNVTSYFGVWDGEDTRVVFTDEQIRKIHEAYQELRARRRAVAQDRTLSAKRLVASVFG